MPLTLRCAGSCTRGAAHLAMCRSKTTTNIHATMRSLAGWLGIRKDNLEPLGWTLVWAETGCGCVRAVRLRDCCAPGRLRSAVAAGMLALAAGSRLHELSRSRNLHSSTAA
jgi:hypothetical protein